MDLKLVVIRGAPHARHQHHLPALPIASYPNGRASELIRLPHKDQSRRRHDEPEMESKAELHRREFASFFEQWLQQQEATLQQLLGAGRDPSNEQEHRTLVTAAMDHNHRYYNAKREMAHVSVGDLFNPPWLSSTERSLMWMAGWRPSSALRLVRSMREAGAPGSALGDLSEAQMRKLEDLGETTKAEEEKVESEMRRLQLAMPEMALLGGDRRAEGVLMGALWAGAETVVVAADELRLRVLETLVSVLTPLQGVDFLAAAAMLQLQQHRLGRTGDDCMDVHQSTTS